MSSTSVSLTLPNQTAATERKDTTLAASMPSPSLSATSQKHPTQKTPYIQTYLRLLHCHINQQVKGSRLMKFVPLKVVYESMGQQNKTFSDRNRGKQCTSNSLTFLLRYLTILSDKKTKATIDTVLSALKLLGGR